MSGLTACGVNPVKSTTPLDLSHPGSIAILVDTANSHIDTAAIGEQIGKNLSGWRYPIASANTASVTHRMTAEIGRVEHGSTPTGFSFSIGNSDPRALDFQKADVLTITCKLESIQQAAQSAELNMGFADSAVTGMHPDAKELSDHVSTVCFNLLSEVNWPIEKAAAVSTSNSPSWMPEIRIETEEESSVTGNTTNSTSTKTESKTNPTSSSDIQTGSGQSHTENNENEPKAVTKEITKEGRKVYIIHNQGNPILFKFGHDRR